LSEGLLDWRFGMFTLFYRFLYGLNIKANDFVVVQQDWLRDGFISRYGVSSVVVARPSVDHLAIPVAPAANDSQLPYRFFYPSYPRPYKNMEQVLEAARILEHGGFNRFEVWLTINGTETRYSKKLFREYGDLTTVRWLGLLPREEVLARYAEAECLLFPSRLETWGMPITEFKPTGKPILAADLPYAHETLGTYGKAAFFDTASPARLAECMRQAALGEPIFHAVQERPVAAPVSHNWHELWQILLASSSSDSTL
jgi:glycosyltransferase involved in cell wall biosynthesis